MEYPRTNLASLALSVIAILISASTGYYVMRSTELQMQSTKLQMQSAEIQHVAVQPILALVSPVMEYDTANMKVGVRVRNLGATTAVVEAVRIYVNEEGRPNRWLSIMQNAVINPGGSRYASVFRSRYDKADDSDMVANIRDAALRVAVLYHSRELPGQNFSFSVGFPSMTWHDKSIVGVKPD